MPLTEGWAHLWSLATLIALLLLWWQVTSWYRQQLLAEQRIQMREEISLRGNALASAINRRFAILKGLNAFVRTEFNQENFQDQFFIYASHLYTNTTGILNIAVAPAGRIEYIYPIEGNESLIGYDLLHTLRPELKEDVELAIESEEIILGFPLDYALGDWGLAARQAIYLEDDTFWGLISVVIDIPTLLNDAGFESASPDLDFRLEDPSGELIYETGPTMRREGITYRLDLPEEPWILTGYPKSDWGAIIRQDLLPIQVSGLMIVLLLSGLVFVLVNRQAQLASAVNERTREIAQINQSLEQRVAARTREITTLMEVSQTAATTPDVEPLLSLILDQLQEIVPYVAASIFLYEEGRVLSLLCYRGPMSMDSLPKRWELEGAEHYKEVIAKRKPVMIPDIHNDSPMGLAWQQTVMTYLGEVPEYFACWMGVPLIVKKRVIGLLVLHHKEANYYSGDQASLAMAFAHQAALAIENTRLYEQVQQVAVLRERQRLARDLHDSVSQALYSIALGARTAQTLIDRESEGSDKASLREPIDHILSMAEVGLAEMRTLIFELRPESLEGEGLIVGFNRQIEAFRSWHKIEIQASLCSEPEIAIEKKLLLYRVLQESLHNIAKHAQARHVNVTLLSQPDLVRLQVQDDGRGFDATMPSTGLGLRSMQERVEQGGGTFEVISAPGFGTSIVVQLPLDTI
jgi:signal transduction histidine kinase